MVKGNHCICNAVETERKGQDQLGTHGRWLGQKRASTEKDGELSFSD